MISAEGVELIARHEACPPRPYWPGGLSGITLGYGYDLAHHSLGDLEQDWIAPGRVRGNQFAIGSLRSCVGMSGAAAAAREDSVRTLAVDREGAMEVFTTRSLPKYEALTVQAFPGAEELPASAYAALVSLVYNRGTAMDGDRRREMREIRAAVPMKDLQRIADEIRAMKRLWVGKGLDGLLRRREDEARLVESAITKEADNA